MSEIDLELDGKKLWPGLEYCDGTLTGASLQTHEEVDGDGQPSLTLRISVPIPGEEDSPPLVVLCDVKLAHLLMVMAAVKGRLQHLLEIRQLASSLKS
jgi:hypothetical protein